MNSSGPFARLRFFALFGTLLAAAAAACGQASSQNQNSVTLKSETTLVVVPAIVTDRHGTRVDGLTRGDFVVKEDGVLQKVAVFEHVKPAASPEIRADLPAGIYTNRVKQDEVAARLSIIAVDAVSTGIADRVEARNQIIDFIRKNISVDQPVALVMLMPDRIRVLHDFTTDPRVLLSALDAIRPTRSISTSISSDHADAQTTADPLNTGEANSWEEIRREETDTVQTAFQEFTSMQRKTMVMTTLDAFEDIARAFTGVPGRKSLLFISNGASLLTADPNAPLSVGPAPSITPSPRFPDSVALSAGAPISSMNIGPQLQARFERVWRDLNAANIAVYPLDISDLSNPGFSNPANMHRGALARPFSTLPVMEEFAEQTSGSLCDRRENLDLCFKDASRDAQDYYLLAYYVQPSAKKVDWHKLEVFVPGKDVKIRSRLGYSAVQRKPADPRAVDADMGVALGSPLEYTSLPIQVNLRGMAKETLPDGKRTVNFAFFVPPSADFITEDGYRIDLEFVALAKLADGKPAGEFARQAAGALKPEAAADLGIHGMVLDGSMELTPGDYQLRFVVRDNQTGRMGSVTVPLHVAADSSNPPPEQNRN